MIKKLELNEEYIKTNWVEKEDQDKLFEMLGSYAKEFLPDMYVLIEFPSIFLNCFKGYENVSYSDIRKMQHEHGYGITIDSIKKYINENYGEKNPNEYVVYAGLMPMDYDTYYKNGTFIDLNGIDTNEDFWCLENADELSKQADISSNFITYEVYKLPKIN